MIVYVAQLKCHDQKTLKSLLFKNVQKMLINIHCNKQKPLIKFNLIT